MKKTDILASIIIAELDAWLIILIIKNLEKDIAFPPLISLLIKFSPLILPVLAVLGLFVASWLRKKVLSLFQLYKFVLAGSLNTFIDIGILSLLMYVFGIYAGLGFSLFKAVSFITATTNSYLWNKFWTFRKPKTVKPEKEFFQFFIISVFGFAINLGTASVIVNAIGPQFSFSLAAWGIIGGIAASFVGLTWNFLGYKFIVFKK